MAKIKITEHQARILGLKQNLKVKITKEQYNRIFATGLINEDVTGGPSRVDKTFKKEFTGKGIENLKETDFNISKPNSSIPSTPQTKFNQPVNEGGDSFHNEVINLIKYMYRKSDEFSPYWTQKGVTYEEICDSLASKNMVVSENGKCVISRSLGEPQQAIQTIEAELRNMVGETAPEAASETAPDTEIQEDGNLPAGAENDPRAPWNQKEDPESQQMEPENNTLELANPQSYNNEIAILKDASGQLYVFYHYNISKVDDNLPEFIVNAANNMLESGKINLDTVGIDAWDNGQILVKVDDNVKMDILRLWDKSRGIVSALSEMNEAAESEDERMARLKSVIAKKRAESEELENKRQARIDALNAKLPTYEKNVEETTGASSSGAFTAPLDASIIKKEMPVDTNNLNVPVVREMSSSDSGFNYTHYAVSKADNKIVDGWDYSNLYDAETRSYDNASIKEYSKGDLADNYPDRKPSDFKVVTGKFLERNGIDPNDTNNWYKIASVNEMTSASSSGQYTANAFPNIDRDGKFKNTKKIANENKTQFAGGSFVDFNDCTKLNNEPAGSGCSQGAIDGVVKTKKGKGNVSAPSLSED